jgi:internalin A
MKNLRNPSVACGLVFLMPVVVCVVAGCGGGDAGSSGSSAVSKKQLTGSVVSAAKSESGAAAGVISVTPQELRRRLNCYQAEFQMQGTEIVEVSLFQTGVRDISALRGLPLRALDLGITQVTDLGPLQGMKLERLDLENVPVTDISVLSGMPLKVLKMQKSKVSDFAVLGSLRLEQLNVLDLPFADSDLLFVKESPLETIWLAGTKDLTGLPLSGLKSLDIERTAVSSLAPLAGSRNLVRLNIAESAVTDLAALQGLRLQRITLSPERITAGMEVLRGMESLKQIQTSINEPMSAADFWKRYDLGVYRPAEVGEQ